VKCTDKNKKQVSKRELRKKEMRKRQIRRTLFLLLFMVIAGLSGVLAIMNLRQEKEVDTVLPFSAETEIFGKTLDASSQTAAGFAHDLCTGADGVTLEGVHSSDNEMSGLFDLSDHTILFSDEIYKKAYPASITKIMTAIVALENVNMDDIVTIPESAMNLEEGSQNIGFSAGDTVTMDRLLHCLLVYSGNDAAMAIAEHVGGGDISAFVDMMNAEAKALGATSTHFVNPSGLHNEDHYTTVYDIYLMLNKAMSYKEFVEITQLSNYTVNYTKADGSAGSIYMEASDKYLTGEVTAPKGVTLLGGKTGTTSRAGACLAIMTQNEYGKPYISIVLNAKTKDNLYERMNELLSYINS
jgi:D-alanyl-D-alanine carboxypeptidase (penicillin-binding protein 5/6)